MTGIILDYSPVKGYGFIASRTGEIDENIFVHRSDMPYPWKHRELKDQPCKFEIGEFRGKRTAINVEVLQSAENFYFTSTEEVQQ